MDKVEKRLAAQKIMVAPNKTDDQKLFEVFQIYKEDLQQGYSQLYYALLGWQYAHLRDLGITPPTGYFQNT